MTMFYEKLFMAMRVLTPGFAHVGPSTQPPIDVSEEIFLVHGSKVVSKYSKCYDKPLLCFLPENAIFGGDGGP